MIIEDGKFYFIKDEFFEIFKEYKYITENKDVEISLNVKNKVIAYARQVIMMAERGINIPFYDIIEMKNILLKN